MSALLDLQEALVPIFYNETYNKDFNIEALLPFYKDAVWNLSSYSTSAKNEYLKINFNHIENKQIEQAKKLMTILLSFSKKSNGKLQSIGYFTNGLFTLTIVPICNFAKEESVTLFSVLSSSKLQRKYIKKKMESRTISHIQSFPALFKVLNDVGSSITEIKFYHDKELLQQIRTYTSQLKSNNNQTAFIPTRILSESLRLRWEDIDLIYSSLEGLKTYIKCFVDDEGFCRSDKTRPKWYRNYYSDIKKHGLVEIFDRYDINGRREFGAFISKTIGTCKHLIHAYSGMRESEVISLKKGCFIIDETIDGLEIAKLRGITTKLHGMKYETEWITDKKIKRVIEILESIAYIVGNKNNIKDMYLFFNQRTLHFKDESLEYASGDWSDVRQLPISKEKIVITKDDLEELETIAPLGNWKSRKDFKIGNIWKFKSHQYRRSLAVYSLQSGLVSLGTLKNQLKHITREMSMYYGRGSTNVLKNQNNNPIIQEFVSAKNELEALSYIKNVIFSDEKLFGSYGKVADKSREKNGELYASYVLLNKNKTLGKIKKGEFKYKETPLGGCTHLEICDSKLIRSLTACFSCESGVLKKSKVDNTIEEQKAFILTLNKNSPEYKTEMEELQKLEEFKNKLKGLI